MGKQPDQSGPGRGSRKGRIVGATREKEIQIVLYAPPGLFTY